MADDYRNKDINGGDLDKPDNSVEYYNDEFSRKAVGKLFTSADEQREEVSRLRSVPRPGDEPLIPQKPINNYYYEDSRAGSKDNNVIVKGFTRGGADEPADRDISDEKQMYRRQFLGDIDSSKRRPEKASTSKGRRSTGDDLFSKPVSKPSSRRGMERATAKDDEFDNEIKRIKTDKPASRRAERESGRIEGYTTKTRSIKSDYGNIQGKRVTDTPLFRIMCGIVILLLIISVFLVFRLNSLGGKVKEYEQRESDITSREEEMDTITAQKESADQMIAALQTEKIALERRVEELETSLNPPEATEPISEDSTPSTGSRTYTVVAGDSLSAISQKMYGNVSGVNKIMQANNMTSTNLSIGQVLTIPE